MQKRYIEKLDTELSPLGFGISRLPMTPDEWFPDSAFDLIDRAMELGVNYYDTGWGYQGGKSESFAREALVKRYERDSFHLAAKLPLWACNGKEDMEQIFKTQLENAGGHIDFYLAHGLNIQRWEYGTDIGLIEFLDEKRKKGQIKRVGFSFHDISENLKKILDAYPWEFAQLQINYYDWAVLHTQEHYKIVADKGIPCFTMETVGGGRLSALPKEAQELYENIRPGKSASSWAIKFAASLPNVAVMLSGMNTMEQLEDNVRQCSDNCAISQKEERAMERVVNIIRSKNAIPCTGCRYCVSECPKGIDIPQVFECYNDYKLFGNAKFFDLHYSAFIPAEKNRADACIQCGKCMRICTQNLKIPELMKMIADFANARKHRHYALALGFDLDRAMGRLRNQKLVCFGSGKDGTIAKELFGDSVKTFNFCDNDSRKWGKKIEGATVLSPEQLWKDYQEDEFAILISTRDHRDPIQKQLLAMGIQKDSILNPSAEA